MSLAVILPTFRTGPAAQDTWDDLRVCLASVAAYARGFEVVVAWDGPCPPQDLPRNALCRVLARPVGMRSSTAADWAFGRTDATDFLVLSDDVVLSPDTLVTMFEDAKLIAENGYRLGLLGCRSNFAPGSQNIRAANGGEWAGGAFGYTTENTVFRTQRVSPFCALVSRTATEVSTVPDIEWFNDDLGCFDLVNAGYTNWISRAYVHHVGMRSSIGRASETAEVMARMEAESLAWIRANRPDFWQHLVEIGSVLDDEPAGARA